jgi:putative proteasome-type protease
MTYCVAVSLDSGLVFASDSRTNAGIDQISTFRKMTVYERPGDRVIVLMRSGNLSVSQNVVNQLEQNARRVDGVPTLWSVQSLFEAAQLVGDSMREVNRRDGPYLMQNNIDASASFLVGGQIAGERPRLFMLYNEGNFIEAAPETPYFQIGETKYGKPIIDRVIKPTTTLTDAVKTVLISFDSTLRSNVSVGLPIDLMTYERDSLRVGLRRQITETDPYFLMIHHKWGDGLRSVFAQIPDPHWEDGQP